MKKRQKAKTRSNQKPGLLVNPKGRGTSCRNHASKLPDKNQTLRDVVLVVVLLVLSLIPYVQTLSFEFVNYDDPLHVSAQSAVLGGINPESMVWAMKATPGNLWHPLTWISFMAEVEWFGGGAESPGVHHAGNLFLYGITLLLIYFLLRKLGAGMLWTSIGVLLFALHPLHSEPVAWISARKDLLSGFFLLASLLGYVLSGSSAGAARFCWKSLSYLTFAAALFSKPVAVVLPALLILLDWFPLRQCGFENQISATHSWKAIALTQLRSKAGYFLLALATAMLAISVQSSGTHQDFAGDSSLFSRISDAPGILAFYFQRLVWPINLVFEYSRPSGIGSKLYLLAGCILALGISWVAWTCRRSFPEIMLGWLWVLICFSPVMGLFYIGDSYTTDRYWYLALAGPVMTFVFLLPRCVHRRTVSVSVSLLILLLLGTLSFRQTRIWRNDETLFHHAIAVDPENLTALGNLGSYYRVQKDNDLALKYYLAALKINPHDHIVLYNIAHIRNNDGDRTGTIEALRACLIGYPNYGRAHHFLGVLLADPSFPETYAPREGLGHLKKAVQLEPREPRFALNYVYTLHRQGLRKEAEAATATALEMLPVNETDVKERLIRWLEN